MSTAIPIAFPLLVILHSSFVHVLQPVPSSSLSPRRLCTSHACTHARTLPPSLPPSPHSSSSSQANPLCHRGSVMSTGPSTSTSSSSSSPSYFYPTRASLWCGGGDVRHAARSAYASSRNSTSSSNTSSSSGRLLLLLVALSLLNGCLVGV